MIQWKKRRLLRLRSEVGEVDLEKFDHNFYTLEESSLLKELVKDQGPGTRDQGPGTRDRGPRSRIRDQGPGTRDEIACLVSIRGWHESKGPIWPKMPKMSKRFISGSYFTKKESKHQIFY